MHPQLVAQNARPISLRRPAHWYFGRALVLWLALSAAGCTKLVYNRLDTLAGWYMEGLVSLDDTQRADLRSWLGQTLQWHRRSELARYAQFLRELAADAAQPGTARRL